MGLNTPMGTVQITQSEHNFDAHINDADRDGNNAMHMAAKNGRMDIINYFIYS